MKRTETVSEWKMVPVEPTDAMLAVWLTENEQSGGASGGDTEPWMRAITRYRAMLSAAPQPEGETSAAEALKTLSDPINLHRNLLRGYPARLTREQLLHLAGGPQPAEQEVRDLERQLSDALEREKALRQELERVRADEREACARVCDELAKRNFPWGSENADRYHAQADWAEKCAAAIRARKEKE